MGLDAVEFVMWMEDEFHLTIPDHDAAQLFTVGHASQYLAERLQEESNAPLTEREIFDRLRDQLSLHYTRVPQVAITRESHFVRDLGLG